MNKPITLPYNFKPRWYQAPVWNNFPKYFLPSRDAYNSIYKRFIQIEVDGSVFTPTFEEYAEFVERENKTRYNRCYWLKTRRLGFDLLLVNIFAKAMVGRVGLYFHAFPTYAQGKKDVWNNRTRDGIPFLDYFPPGLVKSINKSEMIVEYTNKSIYQIVGTDEYKRLRGAGVCGVGYSEWAYHNPNCETVLRPMLAETGGWVIKGTTPFGKNHAYIDDKMAKKNPKFLYKRTTAADTHYEAVSKEAIEDDRAEGMSDEMIEQEYNCSFEAAQPGAYYAEQLILLEEKGQIGKVAIEPNMPVNLFFDIGLDTTSIWFQQQVYNNIHLVHYYENANLTLEHYANYITNWRGKNQAVIGKVIFPHDGDNRNVIIDETPKSYFRKLGFDADFIERPKSKLLDGIEPVRRLLPRCWFDEENCSAGLSALSSYHKKVVEDKSNPEIKFYTHVHDWSSHGADAFQTFAKYVKRLEPAKQVEKETIYKNIYGTQLNLNNTESNPQAWQRR